MSLEGRFVNKPFPTFLALKVLDARVREAVYIKIYFLFEIFATFITFKGSIVGVGAAMCIKSGFLSKPSPAFLAFMVSDNTTSMGEDVIVKNAFCSKLLLTLLAFKVLLRTVREHVRAKDADVGKFFPTFMAFNICRTSVSENMYAFEIMLRIKTFPTILAFKLLTSVCDSVSRESSFIFETFPALFAFILFSIRMKGHVKCEATFTTEFFPAVLAFKSFMSIVGDAVM